MPTGPGTWRAHVPEHWLVGAGPNGGFLAAVAARAAEARAGRPLRSLSLHFLAAPGVGPLAVHAVLEREGRTFSATSVRLEQEGRPVCLALATLGELGEGTGWDAGTMPDAPAREAAVPVPPDAAGVPAFMANYDMRWAVGGRPGETGEPATGGWMRTAAPRALDGPLLVALTDAWAPVAYVALGRLVAAPTLELTVHVRRTLPAAGMAPDDHVLARFTSRLAEGGVWEEDGELWSPDGRLLVQSRQLALVRELPGA